jgi:hypothetical protein
MKVLAGIVIVLGLLLSRLLAVIVNSQLWLRLLAAKPRGASLTAYANQIYLPEQARRGLWPGLLLFFPVFGVGMAIGNVDRTGPLFTVGMTVAIIGGVLGAGAIWSTLGTVYPNGKLASDKLVSITNSLKADDASEPLSSYRHFWRANWAWEVIMLSPGSLWGSSAASLERIGTLLDECEADLERAKRGFGGDKLKSAVEKMLSTNAAAVTDWRRRFRDLSDEKDRLLSEWPTSAVTHEGVSLRIVQGKPSFAIRRFSVDDVDVTALILNRKAEAPIVFSSLDEAVKTGEERKSKWSDPPIFEFDLVCPLAVGSHKLVLATSGKSFEHVLQLDQPGRYLALVSFDIYADAFAVRVYPSRAAVV